MLHHVEEFTSRTQNQNKLMDLAHEQEQKNLILEKAKENGLNKGLKEFRFTKILGTSNPIFKGIPISDLVQMGQIINLAKQAETQHFARVKTPSFSTTALNKPEGYHHMSNTKKAKRELGLFISHVEKFEASNEENNKVEIFGSVSKHAFPAGSGPGISARIHQILELRDQFEFMLPPILFMVIKYLTNHTMTEL